MRQLLGKSLLLSFTLFLLTITSLHLLNNSIIFHPWLSLMHNVESESEKDCNIFRGKWVPYSGRPYYTIATCPEIFDQQNCMKFGRPDTKFLKWRWKPNNCEALPRFDPEIMLRIVRGKSMAFVGDSLARNQMQSLLCLLSNVVHPVDKSNTTDQRFKHWFYSDYNFTISSFWSPYLVKAEETDPNGPIYNRRMNLYLEEANEVWATQIETFDYVIVSAGRWFFGPEIFYEHGEIIGCHKCNKSDVKNVSMFYGYKKAFRTTFDTLIGLPKFKGVTFLRTLSPAHFEDGEWDTGGNCVRTCPDSGMKLEGDDLELYRSQVEELKAAEEKGMKRGLRFGVLDTSEAMVVRPDGHPNHFGHWPHDNVTIADCVHWCLPGPIDTWNEFLLYLLHTETPHVGPQLMPPSQG